MFIYSIYNVALFKEIDSWGCWVQILFMFFKQQFKSYTAFFFFENVQSKILCCETATMVQW